MTKKHFKAIASIIHANQDDYTARRNIAHGMAEYFYSENPRFDRDRFLTACGILW